MKEQFAKLFSLLNHRERRRLWLLMGAMVVMGILDVIGISSIFPFMTVVAKPDTVHSSSVLSWAYSALGFASSNRFLLFLGFVVLVLLVASNLFAAFVTWMMLRFSHDLGHQLSCRMLGGFLGKPYAFFLGRNSSTLTLSVIGEINGLVNGVLVPSLQTIARLIVTLMILLLVMIIDPVLALSVAAAAGGIYGAIFYVLKNRLSTLGERTLTANRARHRLASESLLGIKELKILQREHHYLTEFEQWSRRYARDQVSYSVISLLPRYAIEIIAFGGILVILLYLLAVRRDVSQALPLIALYAVAGYRLMPSIQQIFGGITQVRFGMASWHGLHRDLEAAKGGAVLDRQRHAPLAFERQVSLRQVTFSYPGSAEPSLCAVDLVIPHNATIGFVGETGSGKTTAIDILLGLHIPQQGSLSVDDRVVNESNLAGWRTHIGYVQQGIHLVDDTIRRNIALGIPDDEIDEAQLREAAQLANIDRFISEELPDGYSALVGERGTRLSGGQRQRICIARALYHRPDVIVFDEATSALDTVTEDAIIEAIANLAHKKTVIMVAHRLTTLVNCDAIYVFERGRIVDHGTFQELKARSATFRALARADEGENQGIQRP